MKRHNGIEPDPEGAFVYYEEARAELKLNTSMLAKQCDMAREAETERARWKRALKEYIIIDAGAIAGTITKGTSLSQATKAMYEGDLDALERAVGIKEKP